MYTIFIEFKVIVNVGFSDDIRFYSSNCIVKQVGQITNKITKPKKILPRNNAEEILDLCAVLKLCISGFDNKTKMKQTYSYFINKT